MPNFKFVTTFIMLMFMLVGCTIPDMVGSVDIRPGMLLSAVRPGGTAEMAELQQGEPIIELIGRELHL